VTLPCGYVVLRAAGAAHQNPWLGALAFGVVLALAVAVRRFVEQPVIDWARALRKKLRQPAGAPAAVE
jgi:peptidoglycan/LPS O-acetylase OafA/YrhL